MGLAGMTVTPERQESVNFTVSYATGVQVIIVAEDSAITSVDDLFAEGASHVIGVQRNTTGDLYSTWDLEDAGLATIDRYSKGADAVQALKTGKVDCVIIDNEPAKAFVASVEGLKILETEYVLEDYAAAMNKNNAELYEAVNAALQELIKDGTVQKIIDKYIPAN
jgi:polar amino acid transport system substrate-binding protein